MDYRNLTAPELVKQWKRLINDNVQIGRDSSLIKQALQYLTPVQILLGIYQQQGNRTISIPQFLRNKEEWVEDDEGTAEIELAILITSKVPSFYYIWQDTRFDETPQLFAQGLEARLQLREWASRILE